MTKTLPLTQVRDNLPKLVSNAAKRWDQYVITVNGIPKGLLMSVSEFESWQETMDIMADASLMKAIKQGEKELKEGKGKDWEEFKKELGIDV